jgi:hypothetical protein
MARHRELTQVADRNRAKRHTIYANEPAVLRQLFNPSPARLDRLAKLVG